MIKLIHLSFNEDYYEIRVENGVITKITKYFGDSQMERECVLRTLPGPIRRAILAAVVEDDPSLEYYYLE